MMPFVLLLLQLLHCTIQKEPLIDEFSVLPDKFHIAHDMQNFPVFMTHAVLHADIVSLVLKLLDFLSQDRLVFIHNRLRHHIKSVCQKLFLRLIPQYLKRSTVDTDDTASVHRMTHNTAVHRRENRFQCVILINDLLLISPLLRHVNRNTNRSHHIPVQIIKRRLVCSEQLRSIPTLNDFLRCARFLPLHNLMLRFYAGRIILLHIPYVCMAASFHLVFRLVNCPAEAIIHLLMDPVLILVPNEIRNVIDGRLKILAGLPEILIHLLIFLPPYKSKPHLLIRHRKCPYILDFCQFL